MTEEFEVAINAGRVDVVRSFLSTLQEGRDALPSF